MGISIVLILVCLAVTCAASAQGEARESRTVKTAQGPVRGYKAKEVFEFLGIPYATAPTGKDRFKAPLPGPIWMNPLEAVNDKTIICPQLFNFELFDAPSHYVTEDCLVANIYMPDTDEKNLPVLVYVHGGGYELGYGASYLPHTLVKSKKIVAVTFNYRLGIHGFLCLGTEGAPGNAGMKDQVALLRWVNKNIANFGGNPNDVTIAGSSAGSSAVDLLMLSKMTDGLYNKVIPESGANVGAWSMQHDPIEVAKNWATNRNFTNVDDIEALEEFFKTASFEVLIPQMLNLRKDGCIDHMPCVERYLGEETFLEDSPFNILKQGNYRKVPILYGFANMEGLMMAGYFEKWKNEMNENFSGFLPNDLQFKSDAERNEVAKVVKAFYFGDKPVGEDNVQGFIDYYSDIMFIYPHLRSTQLQVAAGSDSIFLYVYSFYSPSPLVPGLPPAPEYIAKIKGANHCAQVGAVYETTYPMTTDKSEKYLKTKDILSEMWLNFITTGKPVPEGSSLPAWPPVGANRSPHMDLGEEIKLGGPLLEERARFWDGIYARYYRAPVPPSPYAHIRTEL